MIEPNIKVTVSLGMSNEDIIEIVYDIEKHLLQDMNICLDMPSKPNMRDVFTSLFYTPEDLVKRIKEQRDYFSKSISAQIAEAITKALESKDTIDGYKS